MPLRRAVVVAWASALVSAAALLVAPWRGHIDDFDAQIYLVVARNLARDHAFFDLRYLPSMHPVLREHLPFGFWPAAAAIRLFGEWAVNPLHALFMLGAIAAAGLIARRIGGDWAGVSAVLLLGTCESIWQYGGRPLLDPLLLFFATLAAGAALRDRFWSAALFGALATLIKGPFGLVPLLGVVLANRSARGALALFFSVVPLAVFLAIDPGGGWRSGYLHGQLLASASGARADGVANVWFPFFIIAGRFWPGLPFALAGLAIARRWAPLRRLAIACVLGAALLCLPARKWGNHTYVVFPLLAALGGVALGRLLGRVRPVLLAQASVGVAAAAMIFSASGLGRRVLRPPCVFSTELAAALDEIPRGSPILVVPRDVDAVAILAAERDLLPWPSQTLPPPGQIRRAVSRTAGDSNWAEIASARGWSVLRAK